MPAPREHLLRHQPVAPSDLGNHSPRQERLLDDPRLIIIRKSATPSRSRDHFHPAHRDVRLKRMVKRRHKPIPV